MHFTRFLPLAAGLLLATAMTAAVRAEGTTRAAQKPLLDLSAPEAPQGLKPSYGAKGQVSIAWSRDPAAPGLLVTIQPGKVRYPGIELKPERAAAWDLSAYGHVEARVVNTGSQNLRFSLRVDNEGDWRDNPWNTEEMTLGPGASGTVTVIFGHSFGRRPGFALKPAAVTGILMYCLPSPAVQSFRVLSLAATGPAGEKPPLDPNSLRLKPKGGVLLGPGVKIDAATQIEATGGAQGTAVAGAGRGPSLRLVFPAAKKPADQRAAAAPNASTAAGQQGHAATAREEQAVTLKPRQGRWDLGDAIEVRIELKNEGLAPVTPSARLLSNGGPTDLVTAAAPLAPGARQELVVPFAAGVPFVGVAVSKPGHFGGRKGTGTRFTSDAVAGVKITARHGSAATLSIESVTADAPAAAMPEWLGKRPPVPGEWVQTLDENFDGPAIDQTTWNVYGPNYWDRKTHWSKDNLLLGGGVVKFHFEKKPGHHNDDPRQKRTDYVCGFLETYGKWVQRYGYFEARLKLPTVPGLWPTFWLMPDRGLSVGPHDHRQDTANGGMEFDIMEHLTRWGPHRYNIALHWDGYGESHKALGSASNYVPADKEGFITSGLLWTPGSAVFYGNGRELWRWEDPRVANVAAGIIIEITTGGWDNNAVDDAQLPADYLIDYVRVWQRKDLASPVDGRQPAAKAPAK
jgi:beta-glucanase (GH16 family)